MLKECIPPILITLLFKEKPSFNGIYKNYSDIVDDHPWSDPLWINFSRKKIESTLNSKNLLPSNYTSQLVLLLNVVTEHGPCKVLDFSGGTGIIYHAIKDHLTRKNNVFWHVADSHDLVELGKKYVFNDDNLTFSEFDFSRYPQICSYDNKPDIVFINTSLQYFPDYRQVLQPLIEKNVQWFVLSRTLAGNTPQFTTRQRFGKKFTPCTFINSSDLTVFFRDHGYDMIFQSEETAENLVNQYSSDIDSNHRIKCSLNVIYKKQ